MVNEIFRTDSKVVLGYIANDARRFHTIVGNKVQQIRDRSMPDQGRYVDTKSNPVDDASRGLGATFWSSKQDGGKVRTFSGASMVFRIRIWRASQAMTP